MNFEQAKAPRIQQWRDTLDDHDYRIQNAGGVWILSAFGKSQAGSQS
ncbi:MULTISPECIES: hypothetical protein [Pseudomonas]|nr:hypothetical protein [Pseudomonas fluorescens]